MAIDVTDATFETEVLERVDDGPGRRRPVGAVVRPVPHARPDPREGHRRDRRQGRAGQGQRRREPADRQAFQVQSIPAVYALQGRPGRRRVRRRLAGGRRHAVRRRRSCRPRRAGDRRSCSRPATRPACARRSSSSPATRPPSSRWPSCSSTTGDTDEALALLARIPETEPVRLLAARARLTQAGDVPGGTNGAEATPTTTTPSSTPCSTQVKRRRGGRQEFVDILELMGPDDPRTAHYRRQLTSRLF